MLRRFVLAMLGAALISSSALAQSTPYQLTCAMSGSEGVQLKVMGDTHHMTAAIAFAQGARPASSGVDPGTCAWDDRGMRAGENAYLRVDVGPTINLLAAGSSTQFSNREFSWLTRIHERGFTVRLLVYQETGVIDAGTYLRVVRVQ